MPSNNVFQYSKIRTRKRSAKKKHFKPEKKMESNWFWNLESTVLESGIHNPGSGIHSMESRIQDHPGFPYMGRNFHIILVLVVAALYATSQLEACLKDLYYLPVGAENLDTKSDAPKRS